AQLRVLHSFFDDGPPVVNAHRFGESGEIFAFNRAPRSSRPAGIAGSKPSAPVPSMQNHSAASVLRPLEPVLFYQFCALPRRLAGAMWTARAARRQIERRQL